MAPFQKIDAPKIRIYDNGTMFKGPEIFFLLKKGVPALSAAQLDKAYKSSYGALDVSVQNALIDKRISTTTLLAKAAKGEVLLDKVVWGDNDCSVTLMVPNHFQNAENAFGINLTKDNFEIVSYDGKNITIAITNMGDAKKLALTDLYSHGNANDSTLWLPVYGSVEGDVRETRYSKISNSELVSLIAYGQEAYSNVVVKDKPAVPTILLVNSEAAMPSLEVMEKPFAAFIAQKPYIGAVLASDFKSQVEAIKEMLDNALINSSVGMLEGAQELLKQLSDRVKG